MGDVVVVAEKATFSTVYYGECRNSTGDLSTDRLFTGQILDATGLYYYNARYYDPTIGRFISADTVIPEYWNPQAFDRYAYCFNNPLKYVDKDGRNPVVVAILAAMGHGAFQAGRVYTGVVAMVSYLEWMQVSNENTSLGGYWDIFRENWSWKEFGIDIATGAVTCGTTTGAFSGIKIITKGDKILRTVTGTGISASFSVGSYALQQALGMGVYSDSGLVNTTAKSFLLDTLGGILPRSELFDLITAIGADVVQLCIEGYFDESDISDADIADYVGVPESELDYYYAWLYG